jgi:hypothetical protein
MQVLVQIQKRSSYFLPTISLCRGKRFLRFLQDQPRAAHDFSYAPEKTRMVKNSSVPAEVDDW